MVTFLRIGGPILGVIFVKVLVYGQIAARASEISQTTAAAHQILFSTFPPAPASYRATVLLDGCSSPTGLLPLLHSRRLSVFWLPA